jgi:hypothetical protein
VFLRIFVLHRLSPNTETCTVLTLQTANPGESQCSLVPNLGINSNLNFVGIQETGVILVELDSAVGERAPGIEEERAIGERKLESGMRSKLWAIT